MFGLFKKNPDKLLKSATRSDESGDIARAVESLRRAYKAISKTRVSYPIETFLRLPLYLQKAGEGGMAWHEFNQLLEGRYHLAPTDKDLISNRKSPGSAGETIRV